MERGGARAEERELCALSTLPPYAHAPPSSHPTHPGRTRTGGHFGFAGHGDPVAFRDVRIRRLPKTDPAD